MSNVFRTQSMLYEKKVQMSCSDSMDRANTRTRASRPLGDYLRSAMFLTKN